MPHNDLLKLDVELVSKIKQASQKAILSLFSNHKEQFYYCSLITDGFANCPILSAWSWEALERETQKDNNVEEAKYYLKWSYADSPYCMYGNEYFSDIRKIFDQRNSLIHTEKERQNEFYIRMNSMERAMFELDEEGLFGTGKQRLGIVINVETMPPDYENTKRAIRLNPKAALDDWLEEIAEEEPEEDEPKTLVDIILIKAPKNGLKDLVTIKKALSLNLTSKELISASRNIPTKLVTGIDKDEANNLIQETGQTEIFELKEYKA